VSRTLFFTSYGGCIETANGRAANVYRATFTYVVGSRITIGEPEGVACTNDNVDGLLFTPGGSLLVGGRHNGVHKIDPRTGRFSTIKVPVLAFHLMLDPSRTLVWVSEIPGRLATIALTPGSEVALHELTGDDTVVTTIAWDRRGNAYYTSSGSGGGGSFGKLDLAARRTTRVLTGLPAAHGMAFDPYTDTLILMGSNHITQISVGETPTIVSDLTASGEPLDQGTVDGQGHLFAACNCGSMVFVDYSVSKRVADAGNFSRTVPLVALLDDIAPMVGPGAAPPSVAAPPPPKNVQVTEEQGRIRIVLDAAILFDFDKSTLKPSALSALTQIKTSIIDKHPGTRIIVEGHTDDRGAQAYNLRLSTKRAQSVTAWLKQHGIAASRIKAVGYGKGRPRFPNTTDANRARNRRVEIIVTK
jgi:outer membrane protein OmpA-like peptidoglycan-associated protein